MKKAFIIAILVATIIGGVILTKASKQVVKKMEVNPYTEMIKKTK